RRLPATLRSLASADPDRELAVCRELTKRHEQIARGAAAALAEQFAEPPKGEITLVLGPGGKGERLDVAAAAEAVAQPVADGAAWTWPVKGPVLQKFTMGADPYAAGQHRGIDIGATAGATVSSPVSGKVSFAGTVPVSGKCVTIQTADGYSVTLTHLGSMSVQ